MLDMPNVSSTSLPWAPMDSSTLSLQRHYYLANYQLCPWNCGADSELIMGCGHDNFVWDTDSNVDRLG
jgi:hypothetical protein